MSKTDLAAFLRDRRRRMRPVPSDGRARRTPGLRREEVAGRANMSVEYYTRLEQGRGAQPSSRILESLSDALGLDRADRARLFALGAASPTPPPTIVRTVRPHLREMVRRMPTTAAIVTAADYDVIACNPLADALLGHLAVEPNLARRYFLTGRHWSEHADGFAEVAVGRLRGAATRYPADDDLGRLLHQLHECSDTFRTLWAQEPTHVPGHRVKTVDHPSAGRLRLSCDVLLVPEDDQQVVLITAEPGSREERALASLAAAPGRRSQP